MLAVINCRNERLFLADLREARSAWQRFAGLMLRPALEDGRGLLFQPARGVHTHFMRFPIDLIYFDAQQRVCAIQPSMVPWRLDLRHADAVIEANAGAAAAADVRAGDELRFERR
jgi:uncharacterized membrane protein (UPF0127 family)